MHRDDLVELLFGHFAHRRVAGNAGIVDHDVQVTEVLDGGSDQAVDVDSNSDVASHCPRDVVAAKRLAAVSVASRLISPSTTRAPSATNRSAIANPNPCAPPVTTAVRPINNDT